MHAIRRCLPNDDPSVRDSGRRIATGHGPIDWVVYFGEPNARPVDTSEFFTSEFGENRIKSSTGRRQSAKEVLK